MKSGTQFRFRERKCNGMTPGNYILGRAKQLGLSLTQLAALLHMTYPTLRQRLLGNADWRAGEIKLLEKLLKFTPAEIYALTVDKAVPEDASASARSAEEAWQKIYDGYPLEDGPEFSPFQPNA